MKEVDTTVRIKSENLTGNHYEEEYARSLEGKIVERDEATGEKMWEKVKRVMTHSAREVCYSVNVIRKNPKSVCVDMMWLKLQCRGNGLHGRMCWEQRKILGEKDVWNFIKS